MEMINFLTPSLLLSITKKYGTILCVINNDSLDSAVVMPKSDYKRV